MLAGRLGSLAAAVGLCVLSILSPAVAHAETNVFHDGAQGVVVEIPDVTLCSGVTGTVTFTVYGQFNQADNPQGVHIEGMGFSRDVIEPDDPNLPTYEGQSLDAFSIQQTSSGVFVYHAVSVLREVSADGDVIQSFYNFQYTQTPQSVAVLFEKRRCG